MKQDLQVTGMHCSGCEKSVQLALEELEGVRSADASSRTGIVSVDFDPEMISIEAIRAVIEEQGFAAGS